MGDTDSIVIEDHGKWNWSLRVKGGDVFMTKGIPYDGVRTYATVYRRNQPSKNSEYQLSVDEMIDRFVQCSETTSSRDDLHERVEQALRQHPATN